MSKTLIEDNFHEPEWLEETVTPATEDDLLMLTQTLSHQLVPANVFFQAIAIAAYDGASAFRYANHYLTSVRRKNRYKNIFALRKPLASFDYN